MGEMYFIRDNEDIEQRPSDGYIYHAFLSDPRSPRSHLSSSSTQPPGPQEITLFNKGGDPGVGSSV